MKKLRKVLLLLLSIIYVSALHGNSIRISISDNNFKNFSYSDITLFTTNSGRVYNKKSKEILAEIPENEPINIRRRSGKFEITSSICDVAVSDSTPLVITCKDGMLGIQGLLRNGKQALYRGAFEIIKGSNGKFFVVNIIDLEDYLKGVVPNEMPIKFGLEALKAQAIAARNYALSPRNKTFQEFDLFDSVESQVYFGYNTEEELSTRAVTETNGIVATHNGNIILALYSSTAGGCTENYENAFSDPKTNKFPGISKPYLVGKQDVPSANKLESEHGAKNFYTTKPKSFDNDSKYYRWKLEWTAQELSSILTKTLEEQISSGFVKKSNKNAAIGYVKDIKVKKRGVSGKVIELDIITNKQTITVQKELIIRKIFQKNNTPLPSANIVFTFFKNSKGDISKIVVHGGGFGHGVGMSQYGAFFMGTKLHKTFDKILKRYYSGISISTVPAVLASNGTKVATRQFYSTKKSAKLVVHNTCNAKNLSININGKKLDLQLKQKKKTNILTFDISAHLKQGVNIVQFELNESSTCKKPVKAYIDLF